ncbi:MAG TPA: metalloregulator ArsR/SmtB family transcription factor [Thermoplasmata archaeon]|nr:metalloregulator ArsR/SmtB family transcription factor [Thermoplasmata archaeon]
MAPAPAADYDAIFGALSHPIRRDILARLAVRDAGVEDLAAPYNVSLPTISRHLKRLEDAGLVAVTRDWRYRTRHLNVRPLADAFGWLAQYRAMWDDSFDRLERVLGSAPRSRAPAPPPRRRSP